MDGTFSQPRVFTMTFMVIYGVYHDLTMFTMVFTMTLGIEGLSMCCSCSISFTVIDFLPVWFVNDEFELHPSSFSWIVVSV